MHIVEFTQPSKSLGADCDRHRFKSTIRALPVQESHPILFAGVVITWTSAGVSSGRPDGIKSAFSKRIGTPVSLRNLFQSGDGP